MYNYNSYNLDFAYLITCSENCLYQIDGYCTLKESSIVATSNFDNSECAYFKNN